MKKTLLSLMTVGAAIAPIATVVACGTKEEEKNPSTFVPKDLEFDYDADNDAYDVLLAYETHIPASEALDTGHHTGVPKVTQKQHITQTEHILVTQKVIHELVEGSSLTNIDVTNTTIPDEKKQDFTYELSSKFEKLKYSTEFWTNATKDNFEGMGNTAKFNDYQTFVDALKVITDADKANGTHFAKHVKISNIPGTNLVYKFEASESPETKKDIVIGAHYDHNAALYGTTGMGTNDNNSGVAVAITVARYLKDNPLEDYNVIIGFWDAEENGLNGSRAWVESLTDAEKANIAMYINNDSVAGGDYVYFGHGQGQQGAKEIYETIYHNIPKAEGKIPLGTSELKRPNVRFGDEKDFDALDPGDYKEGEQYEASDHTSFINENILALGFESSNYDVFGSYGRDGYSQTANPYFWYTEADETNIKERMKDKVKGSIYGITGKNENGDARSSLKNDGRIWHTNLDNHIELMQAFGKMRINDQMWHVAGLNIAILENFSKFI